jgi:hypothetical protein
VWVELDKGQRSGRGRWWVFAVLQDGGELHELEGGLYFEQRLLLRDETELTRQPSVAPRVAAEHSDGALRRSSEAAEHADQRRFTGAVGPQQRRHTGTDREGDVGDGYEIAEPFRHVVDRDQRRWRRRWQMMCRGRQWGRQGRHDRGHRVTAIRR